MSACWKHPRCVCLSGRGRSMTRRSWLRCAQRSPVSRSRSSSSAGQQSRADTRCCRGTAHKNGGPNEWFARQLVADESQLACCWGNEEDGYYEGHYDLEHLTQTNAAALLRVHMETQPEGPWPQCVKCPACDKGLSANKDYFHGRGCT